MSRKDVTDYAVCLAYHDRAAIPLSDWRPYPYEMLMERTGEPMKVCYAAMERACNRGFIEYGVSLRSGWLTDAGEALVASGATVKS